MALPPDPPDLLVLARQLGPQRLMTVVRDQRSAEVDGRYLHWEEVRRRTPPKGLSREEWWFSLSNARAYQARPLPLLASNGLPFRYVGTDSVQKLLHRLDRELGSPLGSAAHPIASGELHDQYLIQSLMEEAITSSQLEGASTTRVVAKEMLRSGRLPRTPDERMIANNFRAMEFVRERVTEPLSVPWLLDLHRILTEGTMADEETGRFRKADEHVTVQDLSDGDVVHVPPEASTLERRMKTLCDFANGERDNDTFVHPIVRAIVLHFGLAYDHPFIDGNGRTARALFYWSLLRQNYGLAEFISISRVLRKAKGQYARAFVHVETDSEDATYFVVHQLQVLQQAVDDLHAYLKRKTEELRETDRSLRRREALNYRQRALVSHALRHPGMSYTIEWYLRENGVVYQTARNDLLALAAEGLLTRRKVGRTFVFDVPTDLERQLKRTPK